MLGFPARTQAERTEMTGENATTMAPEAARDGEALLQRSKIVCMAPWVHAHLSSLGDFTPCCETFEAMGRSEGATLVSH